MRRGFTLIEVMVALGIMAVIAMITFGVLAGTLNTRDYLDESDLVDRSARVALGRITHELQLAFLTENVTAVNTYRTVFIGKDNNDTDEVWFASMSHHRTLRDSRECDQAEITIWTEPDPNGEGGDLVLLHRESERVDHEPDKNGVVLPLATGLKRFNLRYLDPTTNQWKDDWDTTGVDTANRLPRAIEVTLVLEGPDPEDEDRRIDHPYITTVLVERASRMKKGLLSSDGSATVGGGGS